MPGDIKRQLDPDYDAIYAAVVETARGRWFLDEYARRNRTADTGIVLAAVDRLEDTISKKSGAGAGLRPSDVSDLSEILARARTEISAISHPDRNDPAWRETAALRIIDAMGAALQQIEERIGAISVPPAEEKQAEMPSPGVRSGADAAVGQFLQEIAAVYADDVRWAGEPTGKRPTADTDRAAADPIPDASDSADAGAAAARDASPRRAPSPASSDLSAHASDPKIVRLR